MAKLTDLKTNKSLFDPNFESYKLSLTKMPIHEYDLDVNVNITSRNALENVFSYEKIKYLTLHNYLIVDPSIESHAYYVDNNGQIICFNAEVDTQTFKSVCVGKLDKDLLLDNKKFPVCLSFSSKTKAVVMDGAGSLYIFETGDRSQPDNKWTVLYKDFNEKLWLQSMLLHSSQKAISKDTGCLNEIMILISRFENVPDHPEDGPSIVTQWLTLEEVQKNKYEITCTRNFSSKSIPYYASVDAEGPNVFIGCLDEVQYIPDWSQQLDTEENLLNKESNNGDANNKPKKVPAYTWNQNLEEVNVNFILPEGTNKNQIVYSLSKSKLNIGIKDKDNTENVKELLAGELHADADPEQSTWVISDNKLEVTIHKKNTHDTWDGIVDGDDRGEFQVDPHQAKIISEQLSKYTSETEELDGGEQAQITGLGKLEDCDRFVEPSSALYCFSNNNEFIHKANTSSNHWLFNCNYKNKPCFVLRHDVDAVVWECNAENTNSPWQHKATFNALGFVHASKKNLKYGSSSNSGSYAALCEEQHRIFVYHQPTAMLSPLRNRKTGQEIGHISKQHVVTIPSNDLIIGFQATDTRMFVLTESKIFIIKVLNE